MTTPDELAAKLETWLEQGHGLVDQIGALDGEPEEPGDTHA